VWPPPTALHDTVRSRPCVPNNLFCGVTLSMLKLEGGTVYICIVFCTLEFSLVHRNRKLSFYLHVEITCVAASFQ
jgi:hypothetical protein